MEKATHTVPMPTRDMDVCPITDTSEGPHADTPEIWGRVRPTLMPVEAFNVRWWLRHAGIWYLVEPKPSTTVMRVLQ